MSLRTREEPHGTSLLHTRPKGLPIGTTGPLYSDAIRLRKGVTISGTTTPPTFVDSGRRSFQEPFVPRRAPSPLVPNGGLDIEALVAKAKTNLCVCDDELDTDATMRERAEQVKKWYEKKKAQVLEKLTKKKKKKKAKKAVVYDSSSDSSSDDECLGGGKPPCTDPNRISATLDEARAMVEEHAMEVHGTDLTSADEATRELHARVAEALATGACGCDDEEDTDAIMDKVNALKQWVRDKTKKKKKDKCDNPKTPLDEIRCDIEKEKEEEDKLTKEQKQEKKRQQMLDAGILTKMIFEDTRMREALEDLGLVHVTTGKHLEPHELTSEELEMALDLADVDLDSDAE
jgi:hypothetical protein